MASTTGRAIHKLGLFGFCSDQYQVVLGSAQTNTKVCSYMLGLLLDYAQICSDKH